MSDTKAKPDVLLSLKGLSKYFNVSSGFLKGKSGTLKAVDNVSLDIYRGEAFGLVGESGCGKTTLGKMIAGLYTPTSGQIFFDGTDLASLRPRERRHYCKDIQMIFQDPYSSLNPRMTVEEIISEPMIVNKTHSTQNSIMVIDWNWCMIAAIAVVMTIRLFACIISGRWNDKGKETCREGHPKYGTDTDICIDSADQFPICQIRNQTKKG